MQITVSSCDSIWACGFTSACKRPNSKSIIQSNLENVAKVVVVLRRAHRKANFDLPPQYSMTRSFQVFMILALHDFRRNWRKFGISLLVQSPSSEPMNTLVANVQLFADTLAMWTFGFHRPSQESIIDQIFIDCLLKLRVRRSGVV